MVLHRFCDARFTFFQVFMFFPKVLLRFADVRLVAELACCFLLSLFVCIHVYMYARIHVNMYTFAYMVTLYDHSNSFAFLSSIASEIV